MIKGRPWHKERLFFLISSARHFAAVLETKGFKVLYFKAKSTQGKPTITSYVEYSGVRVTRISDTQVKISVS
jgi:deoxyribodipyrimidine photolyase-like uncharacterized protein